LDFATVADSFKARRLVDDRVRTYAVLAHVQHVPRSWPAGPRYVLGTFYRAINNPSRTGLQCDFGTRSGGVSFMIPAAMARQWARRSADTIYLLSGRVQMRMHGIRGPSPTPIWYEVQHGVVMGTCPRVHPLVAPPSVRSRSR
jgi:hypothetical protein